MVWNNRFSPASILVQKASSFLLSWQEGRGANVDGGAVGELLGSGVAVGVGNGVGAVSGVRGAARGRGIGGEVAVGAVWVRPPAGFTKLNVDAAIFEGA
ncbi:hypothetical protein M5689_019958 [Euphorbia peplus]|nr:hypothetical protein M5689_019958 [Euphorbia peplus]